MDYRFEELLDAHFQMLCQSLLVREYPSVQCLPVGMADGGRDATSADPASGDLVIFQVKFSRGTRAAKDPVAWMRKAIDGEKAKIERLAALGATRYVMITNVKATSQPGTGRTDRIQDYLDDNLPIPGFCWWREDVARRLDNNFDLKLMYPALLSGVDMLRLLLERSPNQAREQRERAIRAYLTHQHRKDRTVRFKEANNLAGDLFKLFIDVPLARGGRIARSPRPHGLEIAEAEHSVLESLIIDDYGLEADGIEIVDSDSPEKYYVRQWVGAAGSLLHMLRAPGRRIVLEGAPGQGKSTLAQYLAEVQRVRILGDAPGLTDLAPAHAASPVLLPLKVELRDLALWFAGDDPWQGKGKPVGHNQPRTLEAALAAHVQRHSGGVPFSVDDLLQVIAASPTLLILDALDEVADLDKREQTVAEVIEGVARLEGNDAQLQVIVTSRPSVVAGAPAFPSDSFEHLTLAAIPGHLALEYAERWGRARGLEQDRIAEIKSVLVQRMTAPHMAELAKNTMQLSILLMLIHLRGHSLPDQRTELYDKYIEVFLDREAEKTPVVSEIREPLLDIHRFLGFHLHAQAEYAGTNGKIFHEDLKRLLREYLEEQGTPELLDKLLTGSERMFVLVANVEGMYEFEVQPLREYFAARHLWETAQYHSAAEDYQGGKPERFATVADNPYWLNVTRFFAGCFTKGELMGLAGQLADRIETDDVQDSTYARAVAVALLQDWVFSKSRRAATLVVGSAFDTAGRVWASINTSSRHLEPGLNYSGMRLPGSAADDLIDLIWPDIDCVGEVATERVQELCQLVRAQRRSAGVSDRWLKGLAQREGNERFTWFLIGSILGVLERMTPEQLTAVIEAGSADSRSLALCAMSHAAHFSHPEATPALAHAVLEHPVHFSIIDMPSDLAAFATFTNPAWWASQTENNPLESTYILDAYLRRRGSEVAGVTQRNPYLKGIVDRFAAVAEPHLRGFRSRGKNRLFMTVIDMLTSEFGPTWACMELGVISSAITPSRATASEHGDQEPLFESWQTNLARESRRRAGQAGWWRTKAAQAETPLDICQWLLAATAWADTQVVVDLLPQFAEHLAQLPEAMYDRLVEAAVRTSDYSPLPDGAPMALGIDDLLTADLGPTGYAMLMGRIPQAARVPILDKHISPTLRGQAVATVLLRESVAAHVSGRLEHGRALEFAIACHQAGANSRSLISSMEDKVRTDKTFGAGWASHVLSQQQDYPTCYVRAAYVWHKTDSVAPTPVMITAERQRWFTEV